ncbi:hypothetical protein EIP91_007147 [Steccherinum ochraceum]|uniref:Uncharacterized protein n=1 Tax=Steccherinum ochraceum TaxID=92696 RepID=A0A4R0S0T7_9APHY|nr:hypothetical protein EIP91_007147 [Steccherinum ochraceum]
MRLFTTTVVAVALAATAVLAAPAGADQHEHRSQRPASEDSHLHRRFAEVQVVDAVYARGVHDGLLARDYAPLPGRQEVKHIEHSTAHLYVRAPEGAAGRIPGPLEPRLDILPALTKHLHLRLTLGPMLRLLRPSMDRSQALGFLRLGHDQRAELHSHHTQRSYGRRLSGSHSLAAGVLTLTWFCRVCAAAFTL